MWYPRRPRPERCNNVIWPDVRKNSTNSAPARRNARQSSTTSRRRNSTKDSHKRRDLTVSAECRAAGSQERRTQPRKRKRYSERRAQQSRMKSRSTQTQSLLRPTRKFSPVSPRLPATSQNRSNVLRSRPGERPHLRVRAPLPLRTFTRNRSQLPRKKEPGTSASSSSPEAGTQETPGPNSQMPNYAGIVAN